MIEGNLLKRVNFMIIERPLEPQPPIGARPDWCYANTLMFLKDGVKVWEQEIPEAKLSWMKNNGERDCDYIQVVLNCLKSER